MRIHVHARVYNNAFSCTQLTRTTHANGRGRKHATYHNNNNNNNSSNVRQTRSRTIARVAPSCTPTRPTTAASTTVARAHATSWTEAVAQQPNTEHTEPQHCQHNDTHTHSTPRQVRPSGAWPTVYVSSGPLALPLLSAGHGHLITNLGSDSTEAPLSGAKPGCTPGLTHPPSLRTSVACSHVRLLRRFCFQLTSWPSLTPAPQPQDGSTSGETIFERALQACDTWRYSLHGTTTTTTTAESANEMCHP